MISWSGIIMFSVIVVNSGRRLMLGTGAWIKGEKVIGGGVGRCGGVVDRGSQGGWQAWVGGGKGKL